MNTKRENLSSPGPLSVPKPWDLVSKAYTNQSLPVFEIYSREALKMANLHEGQTLADIATGPGTLALMAAEMGIKVSVLDFSESMLHQFKRRAGDMGVRAEDIRQGDGQSLPWPDNQFDAAFSMFGLMFFPDRNTGFTEMLRVIKPGTGCGIVTAWAPFQGVFSVVVKALQEFLPDIKAGTGEAPLSDPNKMRLEMESAGFSNVIIKDCTHKVQAPSLEVFWETFQETNAAVVLLKDQLSPEQWQKTSDSIYQKLKAEMGQGEVTISGKANIGMGFKA